MFSPLLPSRNVLNRIKFLCLKKGGFLLFFIFSFSAKAQKDSIFIRVNVDEAQHILHVKQQIIYRNQLPKSVDSIKLLAWVNAYRNGRTPLGKRKLEERKTELYFSNEEERGSIENLKFTGENVLSFSSEKEENIYLKLNKTLENGDSEQLSFEYDIHLPSAKITDYGYDSKKILLKYFFIVPDGFETQDLKSRYYLDMEDNQSVGNYWDIQIENGVWNVQSNMKEIEENHLAGMIKDDPEILLTYITQPSLHFNIDGQEIKLDLGYPIDEEERARLQFYVPLELKFIKKKIGFLPNEIFISEQARDKNQFLGSENIRFRKWEFEIFNENEQTDLNYFSRISNYVVDRFFMADKDQYHWMYNGLKTYLEMEYLKENYSDAKLLGELPENLRLWKIKPLKWFNASKRSLIDRYGLVYQYILNQNLDQPITTPLHDLSKFNVLAVSHFETGILFSFISEYVGEEKFDQFIQNYFAAHQDEIIDGKDFTSKMMAHFGPSLAFFEELIQKKSRYNLRAHSAHPDEKGAVEMKISKNTNVLLPFQIEAHRYEGSNDTHWFEASEEKNIYKIPSEDLAKISINPHYGFPETNYRDNYIYTRRTLTSKKKLRFQFATDIPNPEYNEVFWRPKLSWNNYDKFLLGVYLTNKSLLPPNFQYSISPAFSTGTADLTGAMGLVYGWKPADAFFSEWKFGTGGSYYHYDFDLAYQTFNISTLFTFAKNPRSQINRSISFSYNYYQKQLTPKLEEENAYGKYNLWNLGYSYVDNKAIHENYITANLQWMEDFQKFSAEYYYRWEYAKRKKLMLRVFGGIFLSNHTRNDFFDFGISKVSNYAFNYGLLGQSATKGVLAQQFILAEGGFKSDFNTRVNQWIVAANLDTNLWKIFNIYADAGVYKNKGYKPQFVWDSGIKVNIIPDFLEIYFPIQSSKGFEPSRAHYSARIRYTLNFDFSAIINHFRRGVY